MTLAECGQWADDLVPVFDELTEAGHVCLLVWAGGSWALGVNEDPGLARFAARTNALTVRIEQLGAERQQPQAQLR